MSNLIAILDETLKICSERKYKYNGKSIELSLSREDMAKAIVFTDKQIKALVEKCNCGNAENKTNIKAINTTSFEAAQNLYKENQSSKILVLNFANPVNPGGGVYLGAIAQEEDLCRKSTLLKSLESDSSKAYYDFHRKQNSLLSSDYMILSPTVIVFRNADNTLSDKPFVVSVLTCAAPIMSTTVRNMGFESYEQMLYQRIKGMLCLASANNYKSLVLGAWGCGAFGNDAETVAMLFHKAICAMNSSFDNVIMAVLDKTESQYNYNMFKKYFC
jgi:uncharacterized protein (TIGR02452 family)